MAAFADFDLHEYPEPAKCRLRLCNLAAAELEPLEMEVWAGIQDSGTSLFQVVAALPEEGKVILKDLLNEEEKEFHLTDMEFSRCPGVLCNPLMFTRVVRVRDYCMSTGFFFAFDSSAKERLLQSYRHKMKRVALEVLSRERFIFFRRKWREIGFEGSLAEVPGL